MTVLSSNSTAPGAANSPVEVVTQQPTWLVGRIDASRDRLNDRAAAEALSQILREGLIISLGP